MKPGDRVSVLLPFWIQQACDTTDPYVQGVVIVVVDQTVKVKLLQGEEMWFDLDRVRPVRPF